MTCERCGHSDTDHKNGFLCWGDDGGCRCAGWKEPMHGSIGKGPGT